MNQNMPHSDDGSPVHLRMSRSDVSRKMVHSLTDDCQVPQNCIQRHLRQTRVRLLQKRTIGTARLNCRQDVCDPFCLRTSHRATASVMAVE